MKKNIMLFTILTFIPALLSSCGSQTSKVVNSNPTVQPTITPQITKQVTETPLQQDYKNQPFLKFAASEEIIANCSQLAKEQFLKGYESSQLNGKLTTDTNEIALALKRVTKEDTPIKAGNFAVHNTDNGIFITYKNDPRQKSICRIPSGYYIDKLQTFANNNGDLFFYVNSEVFHITNQTKNIDFFHLEGIHWFSNNGRYLADCIQTNEGRIYDIIDLDLMMKNSINIPKDKFNIESYSLDNFIIGNEGQLVICDGPRGGVGDKWIKVNTSYNDIVTGFKAKNVYKATFNGMPLFVNNNYLLFTNQLSLDKLSLSGSSTLVKYLNFEKPYYDLTLEPITNSNFVSPFHKRAPQAIFANGTYFIQNSPAYSFDYITTKLEKVVFDSKTFKFIKQ